MNATPGHHLSQRLKVGAIGLAVVVVLIVLAGAILGSVARHPAGTRTDLAANLSAANGAADEPLAAMGVAPGAPENKAAARP